MTTESNTHTCIAGSSQGRVRKRLSVRIARGSAGNVNHKTVRHQSPSSLRAPNSVTENPTNRPTLLDQNHSMNRVGDRRYSAAGQIVIQGNAVRTASANAQSALRVRHAGKNSTSNAAVVPITPGAMSPF